VNLLGGVGMLVNKSAFPGATLYPEKAAGNHGTKIKSGLIELLHFFIFTATATAAVYFMARFIFSL
jgi:hypothetical protein